MVLQRKHEHIYAQIVQAVVSYGERLCCLSDGVDLFSVQTCVNARAQGLDGLECKALLLESKGEE